MGSLSLSIFFIFLFPPHIFSVSYFLLTYFLLLLIKMNTFSLFPLFLLLIFSPFFSFGFSEIQVLSSTPTVNSGETVFRWKIKDTKQSDISYFNLTFTPHELNTNANEEFVLISNSNPPGNLNYTYTYKYRKKKKKKS